MTIRLDVIRLACFWVLYLRSIELCWHASRSCISGWLSPHWVTWLLCYIKTCIISTLSRIGKSEMAKSLILTLGNIKQLGSCKTKPNIYLLTRPKLAAVHVMWFQIACLEPKGIKIKRYKSDTVNLSHGFRPTIHDNALISVKEIRRFQTKHDAFIMG